MNIVSFAILLAVAAIGGGFVIMVAVAQLSDQVIVSLALAVAMMQFPWLAKRLGKAGARNRSA